MNDQTDMNKGFFKDKLGSYQVDPPEKVWSEISAQIKGGRSRKGMYLILLASAASFALALTLGIHFLKPELPKDEAYAVELQAEKKAPAEQRDDSKLEQKVAETLLTMSDDESLFSMETKQQAPADPEAFVEATGACPQTMQSRENSSLVLAADSGKTGEALQSLAMQSILLVTDSVPDPVILLQEAELADLGADPDLMLPVVKNRDPRWMLGAVLSPLYSFRDAQASAIPDSPVETGMLSYSTGVNVSYRRNSRFAIETGIYYNKTGIAIGAPGIQIFNQQSDIMKFGVGSERADIRTVSNSVGNIIAYSGDIYMNGYKINAENTTNTEDIPSLNDLQTSDQGIQQHLDYLELPFNLRYSIVDRTIELQLVGGMSANFLPGDTHDM